MADLLLKGQRVIPQKALELGFQFRFPDPDEALEAIGVRS
jgi:NAD dependent epimerase/dehydratase family enzyme